MEGHRLSSLIRVTVTYHPLTSTTLKAVVSAGVALETEQTTLKSMLEASIQFQIPIYQRTYDWTKQNCQQLYDDIMKSGKTKEENYHFIGAITCVGIPTSISDNVKRYQLIDGQQRITSLMLLLRALRDKLDASAVVTTAMIDQLLFNVTEEKSRSNYYKMALADNDDQPFREIMGDGSSKTSGSIAANFRHFTALLKGEDADSVWYGVKSLTAVLIRIDDKDDAQAIFESMNSTGLDLSETDMIQNYMLMTKDPKWQKRIHRQYWRPMEQMFGEGSSKEFDEFLRSYLMMKRGKAISKQTVYREFKDYMKNLDREKEIKDIYQHSKYYADIIGVSVHPLRALKKEIRNIRDQDTNVANPLLLKVLADYDDGAINEKDAKAVLQLVDSYLLRGSVCGLLKGGNKVFPELISAINKKRYVESVERALMSKTGTRRFPRDAMFRDQLRNFPLYTSKAVCKYMLTRLEHGHHKERFELDDLQIEHIMPQTLTDEWREDLGERWGEIHDKYVHTIGNLTLTAHNPEMSNMSFSEKQNTYQKSELSLTRNLVSHKVWGEGEIVERATRLAETAASLWKCPKEHALDYVETDTMEEEYLEWTDLEDLWHALKKEISSSCSGVEFYMTQVYGAFRLPVYGRVKGVGICSLEARRSKIYLTYNTKVSNGIIKTSRFVENISNVGHYAVGDFRSTITAEDDIKKIVELVKTVWESKSKQADLT